MTSTTVPGDLFEDDDGQLRLFDSAARSTFNPPVKPKRSVADWLSKSNTPTVKEGTA